MGSKKTGIVVLGHGSRFPQGREVVAKTAERYQAQHPTLVVRWGFVEMAEPQLEDVLAALVQEGMTKIIVVPLFLSFGHHIAEDLPRRVAAAAKRYPNVNLITTGHIGADPMLCDIIQARIDEAETL